MEVEETAGEWDKGEEGEERLTWDEGFGVARGGEGEGRRR